MASNQIQADPAQLRKIATDVGNCYKNLYSNLQTSKSQVDSLKGVWTGDAASTFAASFKTLYDKCEQSLQTVGKLGDALYDTADTYEKSEKSIQSEASKMPKLPDNKMR